MESSKLVAHSGNGGGRISGGQGIAASLEPVRTSEDFITLMSALMCDILRSKIEPHRALAVVAAGRQLLSAVEIQRRAQKQPDFTK